jgi:hypothetical protein
MRSLFFLLLILGQAFATENDLSHRPKSFNVNGGKAVFADFTEAQYKISYDLTLKRAFAVATINFEMLEPGFPIFDSVTAPTSVWLDGESVIALETRTPQNETMTRYVNKLASTGTHELKIELPLVTLVEFIDNGVKSAFWTSDLDERRFLERYLPANFEFDQVKMTFIVEFIGLKNKQVIYTNGLVQELNNQSYKIEYPSYYTASSIFFHTVPQGSTNELRFKLKSIDGRDIPAVVYFSKSTWNTGLERLKAKTIEVFQELESDYGPFPHPSLTVLQAGMGGMEYCGATMTDFSALGHELFHSYFARGVMPANGNSGWLDEALASWRDDGYQTSTFMSGSSGMSSHPYYTRTTDRAAYTFGARFMSYLDGKLKTKGGLKPFMRHMVDKRVFSPLFVEEFVQEMSEFYDVSVHEDFKRYTYGSSLNLDLSPNKANSKIHRKMSLEELKNYL